MDVDPSGRFFVNPYRELVDPAAIVPGVRDFLVNANQILTENLQSLSKNDLCLYTGSVGVAITLSRLKNHASISSQTDGRREYPELRGSKSGIDRHGLGLCSNELCYSMYRCLQEGRPFEIDRNVYTNRGECDEDTGHSCVGQSAEAMSNEKATCAIHPTSDHQQFWADLQAAARELSGPFGLYLNWRASTCGVHHQDLRPLCQNENLRPCPTVEPDESPSRPLRCLFTV
jgi:hypothetical protein